MSEEEYHLKFYEWVHTNHGKELLTLTTEELKDKCKSLQLKGYSKLTKINTLDLLYEKEYSFYDQAYVPMDQFHLYIS